MLTSGRFWIGVAVGVLAYKFVWPSVSGFLSSRQS